MDPVWLVAIIPAALLVGGMSTAYFLLVMMVYGDRIK